MNTPTHGLTTWQRIWYACAGATAVLTFQSINQLPSLSSYQVTFLEWFVNPLYSGLIWTMIVLEITFIVSGIILLLAPGLRHIRLLSRINWAFGFFVLGWIAALSFFFRLGLEVPPMLLILALLVLVLITGVYWVLRYRLDVQDEIFP